MAEAEHNGVTGSQCASRILIGTPMSFANSETKCERNIFMVSHNQEPGLLAGLHPPPNFSGTGAIAHLAYLPLLEFAPDVKAQWKANASKPVRNFINSPTPIGISLCSQSLRTTASANAPCWTRTA